MKNMMKQVLVAGTIAIGLMAPLQSADAAIKNSYARDYNKDYSFVVNGKKAQLKLKNGEYRMPGGYSERVSNGTIHLNSTKFGSVKISKNVRKTRVVGYHSVNSKKTISKKVTFGHKVKTKYRTFTNVMKVPVNGGTLYVAGNYGVVKYVKKSGSTNKTVFHLKSVK